MEINKIYEPIAKELLLVEENMVKQLNSIIDKKEYIEVIMNHFFVKPGKRLRPALILLSAGAVNSGFDSVNPKLISFAAAVELIHSTSLIHDDIIDADEFRRGQLSLNRQFNNQIAVLAGDILYSHAFSMLVNEFDKSMLDMLSKCIKRMCVGEINELRHTDYSFAGYMQIIGDKTASLMSICCECGGILANADAKCVSALGRYGYNFGISYQLMDDFKDNDAKINHEVDLYKKAVEYSVKARESIVFLNDSAYKKKLENLSGYIVTITNEKTKILSGVGV